MREEGREVARWRSERMESGVGNKISMEGII